MRNFRFNPGPLDPRFGRRPGTLPEAIAGDEPPALDSETRAYMAKYRNDPVFQAMLGTVDDIYGVWDPRKKKTIYRWAGELTKRLPLGRDREEVVQDTVLLWTQKLKWLGDRHPASVDHLGALQIAAKDAVAAWNKRLDEDRLWGKQMVSRETEKGTTEDPLEQALPQRHHVDAARLVAKAFHALYAENPFAHMLVGLNVGYQSLPGMPRRPYTPREISKLKNIPFAEVQVGLNRGRQFLKEYLEAEMDDSHLSVDKLLQNPTKSWLVRFWYSLFC